MMFKTTLLQQEIQAHCTKHCVFFLHATDPDYQIAERCKEL